MEIEAVTVMSDGMTEPFTHGAPAFDLLIFVGRCSGIEGVEHSRTIQLSILQGDRR
jgi:hypothetical protein